MFLSLITRCIDSVSDVRTRRKWRKGVEGLSEGKYDDFDPTTGLQVDRVVV